MQKLSLFFCTTFLLLITFIYANILNDTDVVDTLNSTTRTLKFVQAIWIHGNSAPDGLPYPFDLNTEDKWVRGWDQLTDVGINEMKELGDFLKSRYVGTFVNSTYSSKNVYIRSSDSMRALSSAQALTLGLYPVSKRSSLPVQIVPIHAPSPHDNDALLKPVAFECPEYNNQAQHVNQNLFNSLSQNYTSFFEFLGNVTGFEEAITLKQIVNVYDVSNEILHNLTQPEWMHKTWPEHNNNTTLQIISEIKRIATFHAFNEEQLSLLKGGFVLGHMLANIQKTINNHHKCNRNMVLYSSHDSTLYALMASLKLQPDYLLSHAACLMIELFEVSNETYEIELSLRNNHVVTTLNIPDCGMSCEWNKFVEIYREREYDTKKELFRECGREYCDVEDAGIFEYAD
uniref:Lysosomal acid phosphatase n=1 Tax=Rhabditophanes sp. KR3021 TaxID=114890 RepID=A0AC35U7B9_9BILA